MGVWEWGSAVVHRLVDTLVQTAVQTVYLLNPVHWVDIYTQSLRILRRSLASGARNAALPAVAVRPAIAAPDAREATEAAQAQASAEWDMALKISNYIVYNSLPDMLCFGLRTTTYLINHVAMLPRLSERLVTHLPTRRFAKDVMSVILTDLGPILILNGLHSNIQSYYLGDTDAENATLEEQALQWLFTGTGIAVWIYSGRQFTRLYMRNLILAQELVPELSEGKKRAFTICEKEKCTGKRFAQGAIRDLLSFQGTDFMMHRIWDQVGTYLPFVGSSRLFRFMLRTETGVGRYIVGMSMPGVCGRHKLKYADQNPDLIWAVGLAYTLLYEGLKYASGLESWYLEMALQQYLTFFITGLVIHMGIPTPTAENNRWTFDPSYYMQRLMGALVDIILLGLKKFLPRVIREITRQPADSAIDWIALGSGIQKHWDTPPGSWVRNLALHSSLHSLKAFRKDRIVNPHWEAVRRLFLDISKGILEYENSKLVLVAASRPSLSAFAAEMCFGWPKSVVKLLIQLMNEPQFFLFVKLFQARIHQEIDLPPVEGNSALNQYQYCGQFEENAQGSSSPAQRRMAQDNLPELALALHETAKVEQEDELSQLASALGTASVRQRLKKKNELPELAAVLAKSGVFGSRQKRQAPANDKQIETLAAMMSKKSD